MNRWMVLTTGLIATALSTTAQQPDRAKLSVHYKFAHVRDTTNRAKPYVENMVLVIGNNASVYKSYEVELAEARSKAQTQAQPSDLHFQKAWRALEPVYYQFPHQHRLVRQETLFNPYLIEEALPVIDWRISPDTAIIGGLPCQKATAFYKGRIYTAWFCPSLPLHVGPWKLNGLPGVILQAYDAKKEVVFTCTGIEKQADPDKVINLPAGALKATASEFARLQQAARKNPAVMGQALTIQAGGIPGKSGPQIDIKPGPGPVINNPIERTATK